MRRPDPFAPVLPGRRGAEREPAPRDALGELLAQVHQAIEDAGGPENLSFIPVTTELVDGLNNEWSGPLQMRVDVGPGRLPLLEFRTHDCSE